MSKNAPPPDSPFGPGSLDAHAPQKIENHLKAKIEALSDDEAQKVFADLDAAIKNAKALGSIKDGLSSVLGVVKPLLPIPLPK